MSKDYTELSLKRKDAEVCNSEGKKAKNSEQIFSRPLTPNSAEVFSSLLEKKAAGLSELSRAIYSQATFRFNWQSKKFEIGNYQELSEKFEDKALFEKEVAMVLKKMDRHGSSKLWPNELRPFFKQLLPSKLIYPNHS
jgi:hypothetical protein